MKPEEIEKFRASIRGEGANRDWAFLKAKSLGDRQASFLRVAAEKGGKLDHSPFAMGWLDSGW